MNKEVLTVSVSQLNNYIKRVFEANTHLNDIWVKGELSNFKLHSSGHIYASLKDEASLIKLVMFRQSAAKLNFKPDNGMKVLVRGRISVYERDGIYQIYADSIVPDGIGSLYAAFEKLKAKLEEEGLFDKKFKKPLPRFPEKIGVVTAQTGAAVRDMINVTKRRYPLAEILVIPVSVQGISAAPEIADAISFINKHNLCDVIITGRGGGSIEDLWAFNEEIVARAIFASEIPVVSAVGHETDFTIADFVADLRAPTPSAAAELVCPSQNELSTYFMNQQGILKTLLNRCVENKRNLLEKLENSYCFTHFNDRILNFKQYTDSLTKDMQTGINKVIETNKTKFLKTASKLDALSPVKTLIRGYSIASDVDGNVISSIKDAKKDKEFVLRLKDGDADCKFI